MTAQTFRKFEGKENQMYNHAVFCGKYAASLIKEYKTADVLGVYSAGTYLLFGDNIVLICDASKKSVPFGISIEDYPAFRDAINGAERAHIEGDTLTLGNGAIDTHGICETAECSIPSPPPCETVLAATEMLLKKKDTGFCHILAKEEPADPYAKKAKTLASNVFCALCENNEEGLLESVGKLIGLGGGLTPSGDDLICGALYALHYCERTRGAARLLADAALKAKNNTNVISRRYLESAARGEYFGLVADLINALCGNGDTEATLDALLTVGSSSGGDIAAGILLAYTNI